MKFIFTHFLILTFSFAKAQSPFYNILLQLKDTINTYNIEMKFCKPQKQTHFTNWFVHDTSKIVWQKLRPADYRCGEYFTGETFDNPGRNSFKATNQAMLWENILIFKIQKPGSSKPMYILVPVFIQSFITSVTIKDIPFMPGIYELDKLKTNIDGMRITMQNRIHQSWIDSKEKRKYKAAVE